MKYVLLVCSVLGMIPVHSMSLSWTVRHVPLFDIHQLEKKMCNGRMPVAKINESPYIPSLQALLYSALKGEALANLNAQQHEQLIKMFEEKIKNPPKVIIPYANPHELLNASSKEHRRYLFEIRQHVLNELQKNIQEVNKQAQYHTFLHPLHEVNPSGMVNGLVSQEVNRRLAFILGAFEPLSYAEASPFDSETRRASIEKAIKEYNTLYKKILDEYLR